MAIMITGSTGLLGPYLMDEFRKYLSVNGSDEELVGLARTCSGPDSYLCDLTQIAYVKRAMEEIKPRIIIHAAALTSVDKCEKNPDLAYKVNVEATRNLVESMPKHCRLIYISTDMVYSGPGPHREHSECVSPVNMYSLTKLLGEVEAKKAQNHFVLRTNIYGRSKTDRKSSSFADFLLDSLPGDKPVQLYNDVLFTPIHTRTLSQIVVKLTEINHRNGTFNVSSFGGVSKLRFGLLMAEALGLPTKNIRSVSSSEIPNRVKRPSDTRMACLEIERLLSQTMPNVQEDILNMRE